jgi:hypothetical protein
MQLAELEAFSPLFRFIDGSGGRTKAKALRDAGLRVLGYVSFNEFAD